MKCFLPGAEPGAPPLAWRPARSPASPSLRCGQRGLDKSQLVSLPARAVWEPEVVVLGNRVAVAMASGGSPTDRLPPPFPGAEVGSAPSAESDSDGEDIFTGSAVSDRGRG